MRSLRAGWREPRTAALVCVGGLLLLCAREAAASALSSLTASVGLLAALAGVFALKGWPGHLAPSALSTAGGAILIAGAAWWWRERIVARVPRLALLLPTGRGTAALRSPARPAPAMPALPGGIERERLLADLRQHFVRLQDAWDGDEAAALESLTTPELLAELRLESAETAEPAERRRTEIVTLHAELIGFETLGGSDLASVDYSGLMREGPDGGAAPFRELRMLTRSNDRAGDVWRLARHQTLL